MYRLKSNMPPIRVKTSIPPKPNPYMLRSKAKRLLDLNDNCLLKVLEFIRPEELTDIALVNKRLWHMAQYIFRLKHKSLILKANTNDETYIKMIRTFGHHITSLTIIADQKSSLFRLALLVHCTNMKVLKLSGIDADWDHFFPFIAPNLEEVELNNLNGLWDKPLAEFMRLNGTIKKISIVNCSAVTTTVMNVVSHLKHLELFEFQQYDYDTRVQQPFQQYLANLSLAKNLKVLKLNCSKKSVSSVIGKFVSSGIALEHLELSDVIFDNETFNNLQQMRTLRILKFNDMANLNESHISGITTALKLLTKFYVKTDRQILRVVD